MKSFIFATALLVATAASTTAHAGSGVIFAPVGGTVDTNGPGVFRFADTYNQAGLFTRYVNGVTNFDSYMATNPVHSGLATPGEFFGNRNTDTLQVTYDFGIAETFNAMALWNEERSGIGRLDLLTSLDNVTYRWLASGLLPTDNGVGNYRADVFGFGATTARYVRFIGSGCPQPNNRGFEACAIGEVAFRSAESVAAVPEPATWAMLIAGFGLVGAAARRRRPAIAAN